MQFISQHAPLKLLSLAMFYPSVFIMVAFSIMFTNSNLKKYHTLLLNNE